MSDSDLNSQTRDQLIDELRSARDRIKELEQEGIRRSGLERDLHSLTRNLTERVKELNCLYAISKLREQRGLSLDQLLQKIVNLIPVAFQYPEITCARLELPDRHYATQDFRQTEYQIRCELDLNDMTYGSLEVCYLEPSPSAEEATFLDEERHLLETIGERLRSILELHQEARRREAQQEQLVQFDKMVALGTLVSGVAHEINNPNNFIMLNTPLLLEAWSSALPILEGYYEENGDFLLGGLQFSEMRGTVVQLFQGVVDGARRIKSIVDSLKGFARASTAELAYGVDVNVVVQSAIRLLQNKINRSTERFFVQCEPDLPRIKGNSQRLEQVILNLLQNACEALPDKERRIRICTCHEKQKGCIVVTVSDEGVGIPADKLHNIMDPFFTTKRDIGGTGLGLAVSSSIVKHHGGTIRFSSQPGEGTTVKLSLPLPSNGSGNGRLVR